MTNTWLGKFIAITLLCGVLAAIWFGVVNPIVRQHKDSAQELAQQQHLLQQWQRRLDERQRHAASRAAGATPDYAKTYAQGTNPALISASLQKTLRGILTKQGLRLQSAQNLPTRTMAKQDYVGVRVQFSGDLRAARKSLYAIESHLPYLFVERLSLRAPRLTLPGQLPASGKAPVAASMEVFIAKRPERIAKSGAK